MKHKLLMQRSIGKVQILLEDLEQVNTKLPGGCLLPCNLFPLSFLELESCSCHSHRGEFSFTGVGIMLMIVLFIDG